MQSNTTDEPFWSSYSSPAEPHFDDEATLLSARPVVPIRELTSKAGFSHRWVFGLAVAGALLLGVSATALYYSRFRAIEGRPVVGIEPVSSGVQGIASEPLNLNGLPKATRTTESDNSLVDSNKSAKVKTQAPSGPWTATPLNSSKVRSRKPAHRRETPVADQGLDFEYETRDERRAARREAQEGKRENRERRAGRRSDDLLRIRDIFEGPPRP